MVDWRLRDELIRDICLLAQKSSVDYVELIQAHDSHGADRGPIAVNAYAVHLELNVPVKWPVDEVAELWAKSVKLIPTATDGGFTSWLWSQTQRRWTVKQEIGNAVNPFMMWHSALATGCAGEQVVCSNPLLATAMEISLMADHAAKIAGTAEGIEADAARLREIATERCRVSNAITPEPGTLESALTTGQTTLALRSYRDAELHRIRMQSLAEAVCCYESALLPELAAKRPAGAKFTADLIQHFQSVATAMASIANTKATQSSGRRAMNPDATAVTADGNVDNQNECLGETGVNSFQSCVDARHDERAEFSYVSERITGLLRAIPLVDALEFDLGSLIIFAEQTQPEMRSWYDRLVTHPDYSGIVTCRPWQDDSTISLIAPTANEVCAMLLRVVYQTVLPGKPVLFGAKGSLKNAVERIREYVAANKDILQQRLDHVYRSMNVGEWLTLIAKAEVERARLNIEHPKPASEGQPEANSEPPNAVVTLAGGDGAQTENEFSEALKRDVELNEQATAQDTFSQEVAKIGDREASDGPKLTVRFVRGGTFGKRSCDPGEVWPVEKERATTLLLHCPPIVELATADELKADRKLLEDIKGIKKRRDQLGVVLDVPRMLVVRFLRQGDNPLGHSCEPGEVWEVDEEAAYGLLRGRSPLCELATKSDLVAYREKLINESKKAGEQPKAKRGRPKGSLTTDPKADEMISNEWAGGYGKFESQEELADSLQKPVDEVRAALKRHAGRKSHSK